MKNFIFKSTTADLQKILQSIVMKLDILNKNVLYTTHEVDKIKKLLSHLDVDNGLQKQVDQYFEEDTEHIPDSSKDDLD